MAKKDYYMDKVAKLRKNKKKDTSETVGTDQVRGKLHTPSGDRKMGLDKLISDMKDVSEKVKSSTGSDELDNGDLSDNKKDSVAERKRKMVKRKIRDGILSRK